MGNNTSRPKESRAGLPLSRTDTGGLAKLSRSIRSRISLRDDDKLAPKSPKVLSRKNLSTSQELPSSGPELSSSFSNMTLTTNLPASMLQVEPKEPILIRRNTDGTIDDSFGPTSPKRSSYLELPKDALPLSRQSTNRLAETPITSNDDDPVLSLLVLSTLARALLSEMAQLSHLSSRHLPDTNGGTIDIEDLIQRLLDAGYSGKRTKSVCLKNNEIQLICAKAREIFLTQPSLLELSPPVKVVGDVHGQYSDLIRIFTKCGFPPQTNYLFLGDYVDRGKQSLETILLLLCYKIKYPENFFLLRGNHECANVTRVYGFYDECKRRCNIKTWKLFIDTFNTLPIAAIVAGKIFCVHGGLSPVLNSMDEIRNIARPTDVPDYGLLNDLLWSDPADTMNEWEDNERGVSYVFSKVAINKFLSKFGFDLVCRAHMVVEDGYEFFNDRTLVTVFSAPNYCGEFDNWGAVMSVSEELLCSFELLDPLDSVALKQVMKKGKHERRSAQLQQQRT